MVAGEALEDETAMYPNLLGESVIWDIGLMENCEVVCETETLVGAGYDSYDPDGWALNGKIRFESEKPSCTTQL